MLDILQDVIREVENRTKDESNNIFNLAVTCMTLSMYDRGIDIKEIQSLIDGMFVCMKSIDEYNISMDNALQFISSIGITVYDKNKKILNKPNVLYSYSNGKWKKHQNRGVVDDT